MLDIGSSVESGGTCGVNGVTYGDADTVIKNPDRKLIADLGEIPVPARDLLRVESAPHLRAPASYRAGDVRLVSSAPLRTSTVKSCGRAVHIWYENVTILDDDFILNKERVFEFADSAEGHRLKFDWFCAERGRFTLTKPVGRTSALSARDLQQSLVKAYVNFYMRASFLARAIVKKQMGFVLSPVKATFTNGVRSMS